MLIQDKELVDDLENKKLKEEIILPHHILKEPPEIPEAPKGFKSSCWAFDSKKIYIKSPLIYSEGYTLPNTAKDEILWNGSDPTLYKTLDECFYFSLKKIYILEKIKLDYDLWIEIIADCLIDE